MSVLSEAVRARTAAVWHHRAISERHAQARFRALAEAFERFQVPEPLRRLATEALDDERRHEHLCARTAATYGDTERFPETVPNVRTPTGTDALLAATFAGCALTESLNAALLQHTLGVVEEAPVHAAIHEILGDEVRHARLGWAHLAYEANRRDCAFLAALVPGMLDRAMSEESLVPHPPLDDEAEQARAGNLSWKPRLTTVRDTLQEVVLPGLRLHRIPSEPTEAWMRAKLDPLGL